MSGKIYGLGIGPGDPELITVKALRILRAVPVIAYPAPEQGDSLARSIVARYLTRDHIEVPIRMPIVSSRFPAQQVYDWAADELGKYLRSGRDVAVLCEGDPFFYGSFMYLFGRLIEDYSIEVVPGVSSLTACSAMLGAPLASRNDTLSVLPAPLADEELIKHLQQIDAAAIIKVGRHFGRICDVLKSLGLYDQAHYIAHATMGDQNLSRLADVTIDKVPYFSMILVHKRGTAWSL